MYKKTFYQLIEKDISRDTTLVEELSRKIEYYWHFYV